MIRPATPEEAATVAAIVDAAMAPDVAIGIEFRRVARREPFIRKPLFTPIAEKQARVAVMDGDLTVVEDADRAALLRLAG